MKKNHKINILLTISFCTIVAAFFSKAIPQNADYHAFADARTILSIANFWNVMSNIPFVIFGGLGLFSMQKQAKSNSKDAFQLNYLFFFIGIFLTGFGSAYYHYNPMIDTLVWDRLPMVITFMAFFSIIIGDYIDADWGKKLLFPLQIIGLSSVIYWYVTEQYGVGDLRFYAIVQFLPLLLILLILAFFNQKNTFTPYVFAIIGVYALAKLFETYDAQVFHFTNESVSGHSLKHFAAAIAPILFLKGKLKTL